MNDAAAHRWRGMEEGDLDDVEALGNRVHPGLPEDRAVFAERLALYPRGCLVLAGPSGIDGYAVSHPIRAYEPPALGALLGAIPGDADQFYIHDVVVAAERRGGGVSGGAIRMLLAIAEAYPSAALVSVYGTAGFWSRFGFHPAVGVDMTAKLRPYGPDAVYMVRPREQRSEKERPSSA